MDLLSFLAEPRVRRFLRVAVAAAATCHGAAADAQVDAPDDPQLLLPPEQMSRTQPADGSEVVRTPDTLQRLVHRFTFEEASIRPLAMPINFYRHEAPDRGFPPFGEMSPTDDHASEGQWSFGFELNGGSMAARIPTGVVPVIASGQYIITADVRTERLQHSAVSIAAWLHDAVGQPMPETRVESRPVRTNGRWQQLAVAINAERSGAANLVLELRLAQPKQQPRVTGNVAPDAIDVSGRAWFDNIKIWHAPSIELTSEHVGHIVVPAATPTLRFFIRDLASEPLSAQLNVFDIDGEPVHREDFNRPTDFGAPRTVELPALPAGWYRTVLDLRAGELLVGRQWLDFAVLNPPRRQRMRAESSHHFSIRLPYGASYEKSAQTTIINLLGVDTVYVPIWPQAIDSPRTEQASDTMIELASELLRRDHEIIVALDEVPAPLAESLNIDRGQVLRALASDPAVWRPYLDEAMLLLGLEAQRWQITGTATTKLSPQELSQTVRGATQSLGAFVPDPQLIIAWPLLGAGAADDEIVRKLDIPMEVRPDSLEAALAPWDARPGHVIAHFEQDTALMYTARQQIDDLALRTLYAWRSGVLDFLIDAPWSDDAGSSPAPTMVLWRTLADLLSGRSFLAELNDPAVAECWIVRGAADDDAALIAWAEARTRPPAFLDMLLADGPVTVVDAFGNTTVVPESGGRHHIAISETPVIIEGIDLNLALFRAGIALEPQSIPSAHRLHEVELVLQNPWDISVSGVIRVDHDADWHMNPRVNAFTIRPGGETRLPVDLIFDRNVLSSRKAISATVTLQSDRLYEFHVRCTFEVGTDELHVSARWQIEPTEDGGPADLVITMYVTNRGQSAVTVSAFMHAPGMAPRVRPLGRVGAGDTATQMFRIPGGGESLAGADIRYGVKEVDGATRVNRVLHIPDLRRADRAAASAP